MSSDEDDYMSDKFLKALEKNDTRPGLTSKRTQHQDVSKSKAKAAVTNPNIGKKKLEAMQREKGLQTSLSSNNKGFAMLQKMGYKPGMGIGKQEKGRVDPVSIELKTGRGGLGRDSEKKRKVVEVERWRQKRQKVEETRTHSFLHRMSDKFSVRNAERDLRTAQKACVQLDQSEGLTEPGEDFFWPQTLLPSQDCDDDDDEEEEDNRVDDPSDRLTDFHEEEDDDDDDHVDTKEPAIEFSDAEKLDILTRYLRNSYNYCIWCGTRYDSKEDLDSNCPGNSADAHE